MSIVPVGIAIALAVVIVAFADNSAPSVCLGAIAAPAYAAAALGASGPHAQADRAVTMNSRGAIARGLHDDSSRTPSRVIDLSVTHPTLEVTLHGAKSFEATSDRRPSLAGSLSPASGMRRSLADGWPSPPLPAFARSPLSPV